MLNRPPYSTRANATGSRLALFGVLVGFLLTPISASAQDFVDPVGEMNEEDAPIIDWRAKGLAYIDLPLSIRARFDASYMHHSYVSDRLASPFVNSVGPGIDSDNSLESRIAFTKPITEGIEIEIAWETRNRLATSDMMGFGRQTVGALIRITP